MPNGDEHLRESQRILEGEEKGKEREKERKRENGFERGRGGGGIQSRN
jgi:hypothetical protein